MRFERVAIAVVVLLTLLTGQLRSQITTGQISGMVVDPSRGAVPAAAVLVRSLDTNAERKTLTDRGGQFRFPQLPVGSYELSVTKGGFASYTQGPIVLRLNQDADVRIELRLASVTDKVQVMADASLLNTANAQVGVDFDQRRISELPLSPNHDVTKLALSVAGVNPLQTGQSTVLNTDASVVFSVNGMRVRSNNFMIDGQDVNFMPTTGINQRLNNPDIVAEFRLITNQFAPEYGLGAGSIVNIITKTGGNQFHGTAFWFHNNNHLNSRSNLE